VNELSFEFRVHIVLYKDQER